MEKHLRTEEALFYQAIEIEDENARRQFLDESCQSDREMRQRVSQLVEMHFGRGRILDETTDSSIGGDKAPVPEVGSMIGPYKLLQEIGDGGMGVVFMAEQTQPVRRKVAVKVIKVGMDTRRVVARFESERQAMALMDHPCITKVLDAGATDSGRPYFVMELVRGQSVTKYCDQKKLPLRQRLKIFVQVCNALEHAHQKGIIHRDIKPSNIMVTNNDGVALPKIIDFGIAKATADRLTEKTLFTKYGEMVGTPLYMSPEQAEMSEPDVDTRTDIYSLGVLLYELLTGTTPLEDLKTGSFQDIRDAIRSREPQLASTRINHLGETIEEVTTNRNTDLRSLHRFVRGELDWILMKCLARDRRERYQSAGELAREINRYLNGEAVEAAAPTLRYRAKKFVSKHRAAVAIAVSFAAILAFGTIFSSFMAVKANDLASRATSAEQLAKTRLGEVIKERDRALAAEQRLAELERQQRNRAAIHEATSNYNVNMVKKFLAAPESPQAIRAQQLQIKPMASFWNTGPIPATYVKAQPDARISQTVSRGNKHVESDMFVLGPGNDSEMEVVLVTNDENHECQVQLLQSILDRQRAALGPKDIIVARTLNQLGEVMSNRKNWQESEEYFREAFEILKDAADENPRLHEIRLKLAKALKNKGDIASAVEELKDCKDTIEKMDLEKELTGLLKKVKSEINKGGKRK